MVIVFDYEKNNVHSGSGFAETITSFLPLIKSGTEAVVPIAQTAKLIKEAINVDNKTPTKGYDIFAKIRENIEKKKSGAGFIKCHNV